MLAHQETQTGLVASGTVISVPNNVVGTDMLYMCGIVVYSPNPAGVVSSVVGGGLTWQLLTGTDGCSGRLGNNGTEIWYAFGSPGSVFTVTITISKTSRASASVSRYSGADVVTPVENGVFANTNGTGAPACGGGSDDADATIDITSTIADSIMYGMTTPRNNTISVPDPSYTQRAFISNTNSGQAANLYVHDFLDSLIETDTMNHTLSSTTIWIVSACAIRPASGIVTGQINQMML